MIQKTRMVWLAATIGFAASACSSEDDSDDGASSIAPDGDDDDATGPDEEQSPDDDALDPVDVDPVDVDPIDVDPDDVDGGGGPDGEGGAGPEQEPNAAGAGGNGEPSPVDSRGGAGGTQPGSPAGGAGGSAEGGNGGERAVGVVTDASLVMLSNPSIALDCTEDERLLTMSVDATYTAPHAGGPITIEVTDIAYEAQVGSNEFSCHVLSFGSDGPMVGPLQAGASMSATHTVDGNTCVSIPGGLDPCRACDSSAVAHVGLRVTQGDEVTDVSTLIDGTGSEAVTLNCEF